MEEILEDFRKNQLHLRKVIIISIISVASFVLVTIYYLNIVKYRSLTRNSVLSTTGVESYSFVAEFVSLNKESINFKVENDSDGKPDDVKTFFAYLDNKTINNLAIKTKKGDKIKIYSNTPITEDQEGFVVAKLENYKR